MFAHVYCPDLLVQCERLFRPELRSQALIIYELTRYQGSDHIRLLACSSQARKLGFEMSLGSESLSQLVEQFSSKQAVQTLLHCQPNRELYADMSDRLFSALETLAPSVAPIASDEACIDLAQLKHLTNLRQSAKKPSEELTHETMEQLRCFAFELRHLVQQWLGLEVFVGIGSTKTLAYIGCKAAEREFDQGPRSASSSKFITNDGTAVVSNSEFGQSILAGFPLSRIRGISSKALNRLSALGIHTALELSQASSQLIGKRCSVLVEHIAVELSGLRSELTSEQLEPKQFRSGNSTLCMAKTKPANTLINSEIQKYLASYTDACLKAQFKGHSKSGVPAALLRITLTMLNNAQEEQTARQLSCHKIKIVLERAELHNQDNTFFDKKSVSLAEPSDSLGAIKTLCRQILENTVSSKAYYRSISLTLICQHQSKAKQAGLFEVLDEFEKNLQLMSKSRQPSKGHQFTLVQRYCELDDLSKQKVKPYSHNRLAKSPSYTSHWHEILRVN